MLKKFGESTEFLFPIPFSEIELEIENLYIHLRILLDGIANLIPLFYEKKIHGKIPTKSFNKHWEFFIKTTCINDEYAKYMRERMGWFKPLLKDPRDDYIVHKPKTESIGMEASGLPNIMLSGFLRKNDRDRICELLEKHSLKQISKPLKLGAPLDEALTSLEKISNKLTEEERNFIKRARQLAG
ncbi:MAG: hypothetical protein QXG12_06835 [Thermoproteota archaeon]